MKKLLYMLPLFVLTGCGIIIQPQDTSDGFDTIENHTIETGLHENLVPGETTEQTQLQTEQLQATNYVKFMLVSDPQDFDGHNIDQYFVPITVEISETLNNTEQKIYHALKKLFALDDFFYGTQQYHNYLSYSSLSMIQVIHTQGVYHIYIEGSLLGVGSLADPFVPGQIRKTIEQYTSNYTIFLNNSQQQRNCALDLSGLCQY